MEVRSELGIMSEREPFNIGGMQNPPVSVSQPPPMMPGMRLGYAPDGTAVYKPMTTASHSPYQGGGGGGGEATAAVTPAGVEEHPHLQAMPPSYGLNINMGEPMKRKRGRPRKYGPEGTMALGLVPMSSTAGGATPGSDKFSPTSPTGASPSSASAMMAVMKKSRGRPAVSGRKQQMDALGSAGTGFTPHIITVLAGEDVFSKIMSFSQHGPRAVCILSANGVISNVTLRQPATSGGTVTLEGRFEILSLSGSYLLSENGGQRSRTGGLSVCLAGPDGRILGGGVAGQLTAASPVQVVVGSFIADGRKESKPLSPSDPASAPGKLAPCSMMGPASPPPLKGTMSESSGGPGSPLNQSTGNDNSKQGMPNMPWK